MLVKVFGAAVQGIDALVVTIEVNCSQGIRFFMVGLPDAAVKESHERIVSAVEHNGYRFPRKPGNREHVACRYTQGRGGV